MGVGQVLVERVVDAPRQRDLLIDKNVFEMRLRCVASLQVTLSLTHLQMLTTGRNNMIIINTYNTCIYSGAERPLQIIYSVLTVTMAPQSIN